MAAATKDFNSIKRAENLLYEAGCWGAYLALCLARLFHLGEDRVVGLTTPAKADRDNLLPDTHRASSPSSTSYRELVIVGKAKNRAASRLGKRPSSGVGGI